MRAKKEVHVNTRPLSLRNGSALAVVLIALFVLSIFGVVVLSIALNETKQVNAQIQTAKLYYAARAGADAVASYLIKNKDDLNTFLVKTRSGALTTTLDNRTIDVYLSGTEHKFVIESTATEPTGGKTSRVYLTIEESDLLDQAVFANDILDPGNNLTLRGNVGTNRKTINYGSNKIDGNITLGPDATAADIAAAEAMVTSGHVVTQLSVPVSLPTINASDFPNTLPDNTMNVDTGNLTLVDGKYRATLNKIDASGPNNFLAHGGGQVHLYIRDSINASGTATIGTDSSTMLFLYYDKSDTIIFNGTPDSKVTIYAPYATIQYKGGGSSTTIGSFICDTFLGPSSNCTLIQGPGTMEDLVVNGVTGYYRSIWSK